VEALVCELLKPDGLYSTRAADEKTKSLKLKAIAAAPERL
jgi:hypothetical protein